MMKLENLTSEKFTIKSSARNGDFLITLNGEIDLENPSQILRPYLETLHKKAIEEHCKAVIVNFHDLSFMNSSGIREFVHWILMLNNINERIKYRIVIQYLLGITWQATSLPVFQKLMPEFIDLEGT